MRSCCLLSSLVRTLKLQALVYIDKRGASRDLPCGLVCDGSVAQAKPAKPTAAEIKAKVHAATTNMGGGKAGLQDRKGGAVGHAKYQCPICKSNAPDLKSMQVGVQLLQ